MRKLICIFKLEACFCHSLCGRGYSPCSLFFFSFVLHLNIHFGKGLLRKSENRWLDEYVLYHVWYTPRIDSIHSPITALQESNIQWIQLNQIEAFTTHELCRLHVPNSVYFTLLSVANAILGEYIKQIYWRMVSFACSLARKIVSLFVNIRICSGSIFNVHFHVSPLSLFLFLSIFHVFCAVYVGLESISSLFTPNNTSAWAQVWRKIKSEKCIFTCLLHTFYLQHFIHCVSVLKLVLFTIQSG